MHFRPIRPSSSHASRGPRLIHAALIVLSTAGVVLTSACSTPAPIPPDATLTVELYPGHANPTVPLDRATTDRLIAYLDTRGGDAATSPGSMIQSGFRGLVVTLDPADAASSTIRLLPYSVYVTDAVGIVRIGDPDGKAFDIVWPAVRAELPTDVADAVDAYSSR